MLKKLSKEEMRRIYDTHMVQDFPKNEIKPWSAIDMLFEKGYYFAYGLFQGEELMAYAFFTTAGEGSLLLDYYAVVEGGRGKGTGSAFLQMYRKELQDYKTLILEVENPAFAEEEAEREKQERRIAFYKRNGVRESQVRSRLFGVEYKIMYLPLGEEETLESQELYDRLKAIYQILIAPKYQETQVWMGIEERSMDQKERMLAGLPYKAWMDGLPEAQMENRKRIYEYNHLVPGEQKRQQELLREILGKAGKSVHMEPPFRCDYGWNIEVGENFFANYNCVMLDVGKITIGDNVMFAPNVAIYTAGHPVHPKSRNSGYEYGIPVTIGDNVWIGGNVVVNPGVTIGKNAVIGSGSVVTKDIPENVIAAGNPCRVIREITEADRDYYFKDRKFDVEDY